MRQEHPEADCYCATCDRWFHRLGIMSHRAAHRRRNEDCRIEYSDGRIGRHHFSFQKSSCQRCGEETDKREAACIHCGSLKSFAEDDQPGRPSPVRR